MWSERPSMKPLLHGTFGSGKVGMNLYGDWICVRGWRGRFRKSGGGGLLYLDSLLGKSHFYYFWDDHSN